MKKDILAVVAASIYLLIYCILIQFPSTEYYAISMWVFSPLLIVWMVYTVLKHGKYNGRELGEKEFGYQDRNF